MSVLHRTLAETAYYPPHEPRTESATYRATHHKLVVEMDEGCWICGIRHSQGGAMETHHAEMEWAAANAFDPTSPANKLAAQYLEKLSVDHSEIMDDPKRLRTWLDSEGNMLVLCSAHHRGPGTGIHMISYPVWKLQRYQVDGGWAFVEQPKTEA